MLRMTMIFPVALLLALPTQASAQQVEERQDPSPVFGALVGGLIGGAIGAAVSRRAPHGADFVPAAGGAHAAGGRPGGGEAAHKGGAPGAPIHRKPGK